MRRGLSMIEMLIVIAIVGIMAKLGVSGFQSLTTRMKAMSAAQDIAGGLSEARQDAMTHNRQTGLAIDLSGRKVLLFVDLNGDGVYTNSAADQVLRTWQPLDSAATLSATVATSTTNGGKIAHVVFGSDGTTSAQLSLVSKWTKDSVRVVLVPVTGLVRVLRH